LYSCLRYLTGNIILNTPNSLVLQAVSLSI
jgi:hypothetical protein